MTFFNLNDFYRPKIAQKTKNYETYSIQHFSVKLETSVNGFTICTAVLLSLLIIFYADLIGK